jgi:hypothetical protein
VGYVVSWRRSGYPSAVFPSGGVSGQGSNEPGGTNPRSGVIPSGGVSGQGGDINGDPRSGVTGAPELPILRQPSLLVIYSPSGVPCEDADACLKMMMTFSSGILASLDPL